jgi:hypothetical protein
MNKKYLILPLDKCCLLGTNSFEVNFYNFKIIIKEILVERGGNKMEF